MLALQNCITTSRTVTFILQSNKADIPNFETWYAGHVTRWAADPVMKWAKEARNSIEKQGDLKGHSQVRAEIIAGYLSGPETKWMPQLLFRSPQAIWRSVPRKFQIPHILENGTLLIERRWVDSNLPETEVLEALAHVYGEFCSTIQDLLAVNKLTVPPELDRTRPDPMGELAMNRAIYLSMADGSITGHRFFRKPVETPTEADKKKLAKRYGREHSWERLRSARTFREVAEAYFERARVLMRRDRIHYSFVFLLRDLRVIQIIRADHPSRASRYVLMRDFARLAHIAKADAVIYLGETWTAHGDDVPASGFAVDAKNRGEAIMLTAANSKGEHFQLTSEITRQHPGSSKVRALGPVEVETEGFPFLFVPFFQMWGCLDEEAMMRSFDQMDEMGIQTPVLNEE
ncbi:MAG: hypothetical protein E6G94_08695 [Alphaproteobacteria bacterium]|nr:MAG: hypothetical protein E6G94_08695 [Alphaproteobacteria bacterium]